MKIVILNDMLWGGGRERRVVQLITGLTRHTKHHVTLILFDDRVDYSEIFDLPVDIIFIKRNNRADITVFSKLYKVLKRIEPDVVNPWSFITVTYSAPISAVLGITCIGAFVVDAMRPRALSLNWFAMHLGFVLCKKIVGNSVAGHDAYRTPKEKRITIYNGFDEQRLNRLGKTARDGDIVTISMIGRTDSQKDYWTFIDSLAILRQQNIKFRANIIGQGPLLEKISIYADQRCGDRISILGFRSDIDELIAESDIGVLCTDPANHKEGISNALLEFMAQRKPVVATNDGGTPEIVSDGISGFLVPPKSSRELAAKLRYLIDHPEEGRKMGIIGERIVRRRFNLNQMTERFRQLYEQQR